MSNAQIRKPYKVNMMTLGIALLIAGATTSSLIENRIANSSKDIHLPSDAKSASAQKDKA